MGDKDVAICVVEANAINLVWETNLTQELLVLVPDMDDAALI